MSAIVLYKMEGGHQVLPKGIRSRIVVCKKRVSYRFFFGKRVFFAKRVSSSIIFLLLLDRDRMFAKGVRSQFLCKNDCGGMFLLEVLGAFLVLSRKRKRQA